MRTEAPASVSRAAADTDTPRHVLTVRGSAPNRRKPRLLPGAATPPNDGPPRLTATAQHLAVQEGLEPGAQCLAGTPRDWQGGQTPTRVS